MAITVQVEKLLKLLGIANYEKLIMEEALEDMANKYNELLAENTKLKEGKK